MKTKHPFVYSFREPRCGGTHVIESLKNIYADTYLGKKQLEYLDRHELDMLKTIKPEDNAIVIRCDRKNLVDHFFSTYFLRYLDGFTNVRFHENFSIPKLLHGLNARVIIPEYEVDSYIRGRLRIHVDFVKYTKNLQVQTIYYEDWHKPFDIPSLGLYNIELSKTFQYTKKLPDYKRTVFLNYDEVVTWIKKYKNDYLKKYNLAELFKHWTSNPSR